uniref:Uncharacterized protein n=1 Tax=Arundo donax TaxID=35708 RepID=A0A0A9GVG8_ARUDO
MTLALEVYILTNHYSPSKKCSKFYLISSSAMAYAFMS